MVMTRVMGPQEISGETEDKVEPGSNPTVSTCLGQPNSCHSGKNLITSWKCRIGSQQSAQRIRRMVMEVAAWVVGRSPMLLLNPSRKGAS